MILPADERSYNGLRLADALAKREGEDVKVFLMADAAACAKAGQKVPQGHYNLGRMLQVFALRAPNRFWHWGKVLFEWKWLRGWF